MRSRPATTFTTIASFTLAIAVLTSAAAARKPKPAPAAADYFPLRTGDSWTYRNTESGGYTLKVLSEDRPPGSPARYLVEFRSEVVIHKTFSKPAGWVLLHSENYPEHEGLKTEYEPPKQYLPNPPVPGREWEWSGKDSTQMEYHEKTRIVGFEKVTVPAGKFRAVKLTTEVTGGNIPMTKTYWYAADVGLVKSTTEGGTIKYGSELVDYSFKKKSSK